MTNPSNFLLQYASQTTLKVHFKHIKLVFKAFIYLYALLSPDTC